MSHIISEQATNGNINSLSPPHTKAIHSGLSPELIWQERAGQINLNTDRDEDTDLAWISTKMLPKYVYTNAEWFTELKGGAKAILIRREDRHSSYGTLPLWGGD